MALSQKIKELRIQKGWSQSDLAHEIKANQKQISAYERGVNIPSTEMLIKMSRIFNVSLDSLVFEAEGVEAHIKINDRELLKQFEIIDSLDEKDKQLVKEILNLVILKNKFQKLANTTDIDGFSM